MSIEQRIEDYFEAWNEHDARGAEKLFPEGGTYEDPMTRMPVHPHDVAAVMDSISNVFPDFHFEVKDRIVANDRAVVEWEMRGKNTKPLKLGVEATDRNLHLKGIEIFKGADEFTSVTRVFDQKSMYEQIGMQVIVEPFLQGMAAYGYSKRVSSGNSSVPAIMGMTWIRFRDQSELDRIRAHATLIIQDFMDEPGFISIITGAAGDRAFTVHAWESQEALHRALNKTHSRAKHDFRTGDLSPGVWTSVWKPDHINRLWTRCSMCAQPNDATENPSTCANCGATLPERPPYR
ncbi:MAG: nuclear transport factor 2 family protein [Terracidiphilus sp.]|jgi:steroid delta-isomerase-like uncharacterized protein